MSLPRVLVVTTEPLPLPGSGTNGAGLRAWGLCQGLRSVGFDCHIATAIRDKETKPLTDTEFEQYVHFFERGSVSRALDEAIPDVVVLQHWGIAREIPPLAVPLAIDLHGPHLLERKYWGSKDLEADRQEKMEAFARADFVTCAGDMQREYFRPFLEQAGFPNDDALAPVIPFSTPPNPPPHPEPDEPRETTFVYGGLFLAWQDPSKPIAWLLDEMDRANRGQLLFYGGHHPAFDASAGRFEELVGKLKSHPRVSFRPLKAFEESTSDYCRFGDVALDLMAKNDERVLAFTSRTMIYLHCGLPVIYNDFSDISAVIKEYGCGWTLSPDDETGFRRLASDLLKSGVPHEKSLAASRAAEQYSWDKTISPLADYCRDPRIRATKPNPARMKTGRSAPAASLSQNMTAALRPGRLAAPLAYAVAWLAAAYIKVRLRKPANGR